MTPTAVIIEDDRTLAEIFAEALNAAQFATQVFYDGEAALEHVTRHAPNLVVLDLHLPRVSGEVLLRHIRSHPRAVNTRIVIASADAVMASHLRHQVDFVLEKPVGFHQLRLLTSRLHPNYVKTGKTGPFHN